MSGGGAWTRRRRHPSAALGDRPCGPTDYRSAQRSGCRPGRRPPTVEHVTLTDPDVLDAGPARPRRRRAVRRCPLGAMGLAAAAVAGHRGGALLEVQPWAPARRPPGFGCSPRRQRAHLGGRRQRCRRPATDVDGERRRELSTPVVAIVGAGVVVQYALRRRRASPTRSSATSVTSSRYAIGEADLVAPASGTVGLARRRRRPADRGRRGAGQRLRHWRSKVFSVPRAHAGRRRAADGLVARAGRVPGPDD